jgi:wyosine [tRNA(Phe)-imidazoG37] synthetase (radical SAM superfamily)
MGVLFGPVASRRLGRSLGIDVVAPKTCTYDCVYCESGRTDRLSLKRLKFVEPAAVLEALEDYFCREGATADALTFSSAGEPTLYEGLGELIPAIKEHFPSLPLTVLTNGSLLWDTAVRRELRAADRVVPSLDAVTDTTFRRVNRPHPELELARVLEGLVAFRREYAGEYHLEVLLVAGVNDHPDELGKFRPVIERIRPDRVELNTVVRPPAEKGVRGLSRSQLEEAARFFPSAFTRLIASFDGPPRVRASRRLEKRLVELLQRRPSTAEDLAASLEVSREDVTAALGRLEKNACIRCVQFSGRSFYVPGERATLQRE